MIRYFFFALFYLFVSSAAGLQCWKCENAKSQAECLLKGWMQECDPIQNTCQLTLRHGGWGDYPMFEKSCKQAEACGNNHIQDSKPASIYLIRDTQCTRVPPSSVCRCCCSTDGCNQYLVDCPLGGLPCEKLLPPENGKMSCPGNNMPNTDCVFKCEKGYDIIGSPVSHCNFFSERDYPSPSCKKRRYICEAFPPLENGETFCPSGTLYTGAQCTFTCNTGYRLIGASSAMCIDDSDGDEFGTWSRPMPYCFLSGQSCVGRCGDSADSSYTCQCNSFCDTYKDCCSDYISTCQIEGSCSGRCLESFNPDNNCHCTSECKKFNNCCPDYDAQCQNVVGSCAGRCDTSPDSSQPCQCNSYCESYGDCCSDYQSVCKDSSGSTCRSRSVSATDILNVSLALFDLDYNRARPDDVVINPQAQTSTSSQTDKSPEKFFSYVNSTVLAKPSFQALINLLDNYDREQGINEDQTSVENMEQDFFLDEFVSSAVGLRLYEFFLENGIWGCPTENVFKDYLKKIWFDFYSRKNGALDTSGFEHVFVGEIKSGAVSGFHNWVQFYLEEESGNVNYYGYVSKEEPYIYGMQFSWDGYVKPIGGGAVGVSPQYEMAVFTLCHVLKPGSVCRIDMRDLNGTVVEREIQTYSWSNSSPGNGLKYVSTAYFLS